MIYVCVSAAIMCGHELIRVLCTKLAVVFHLQMYLLRSLFNVIAHIVLCMLGTHICGNVVVAMNYSAGDTNRGC